MNAKAITYDLWHGYRKLERDGAAPAFPFGFQVLSLHDGPHAHLVPFEVVQKGPKAGEARLVNAQGGFRIFEIRLQAPSNPLGATEVFFVTVRGPSDRSSGPLARGDDGHRHGCARQRHGPQRPCAEHADGSHPDDPEPLLHADIVGCEADEVAQQKTWDEADPCKPCRRAETLPRALLCRPQLVIDLAERLSIGRLNPCRPSSYNYTVALSSTCHSV